MGLLFTYALTYGGAAVSLLNPFYGLLVYVCFAIIRPESMWYWSVPAGNYSRIVALGLLAGWVGKGCGNWNLGGGRIVVKLLLAFTACYLASAVAAANQAVAWADVEAKLKVFLPFVVGATVIESIQQLKQLAWVIMLSQGLVAYSLNMSYWAGFNRLHEVGFGGMDNNCNAIAMVCGAGLAFFLGIAEQKPWRRWLAFAAAGLMAHAIMFSNSRGGMLALILTGLATFVLIPKRPVYYAYMLLAVVVGLRLAGPAVWERFSTTFASEEERDASAESRLSLWEDCMTLMARHPLLGIGPHHFPLVAHEFGWTRNKEAHSTWMQLGAENGITGLLLLFSFFTVPLFGLRRLAHQLDDSDPSLANMCRMVIASLFGFIVAAQFVTLIGLEIPYYVLLIGAGLLKLSSSAEVARASVEYTEWCEELSPVIVA